MYPNRIMINPRLLDNEKIKELNHSFNNKAPFKFLIVDNFLITALAEQIESAFPSINSMKVKYKGINENKAEDSSFEKFDATIQELNTFIHSQLLNEWISNITGLKNLSTINDRLGAGLHQGGNNSFLDIHIDYNIHPINKKQRKLNLLIFFNKGWKEEWGGQLELWDKTSCFIKILPSFNRMVLFECNEISYHGYSMISCLNTITRKSYYHYFFQPIAEGTSYHDTIFLTKDSYSFSKKALTKSKEFLKNKIKLIFYKTGIQRFLK
jgi:Rps23 Pro-64 3,4-dihydroxylase Tpa1-like proline 4-hydroxylase